MKKTIIITLCSILFVAGSFWGIFYWIDNLGAENTQDKEETKTSSNKETEAASEITAEREDIQGTITKEDLKEFEEQGENPFGTKTQMNEMQDEHFQEFIHGMSHQKVRAEKKWGFYELHPQRVEWLLAALDEVDVHFEETYREILEKWQQQNFSEVDDDHNAIWRIQNGTIGKATGILSAEEEQEYIESQQ
ncbi:DUF6241 domain-containing protein [Salinibacillus xinjiangensis]|uniref:CTP synthase n=1 Tax=Salinibacillus xinjiangensis TaxID=1229268 RepID=A0A6G1X229_9BACI|nr:DUF6241 domain-containing protein [Salinibacillus xinjiangensis]MRG84950.1 hypothetical protein [Salinibacillus xinjiangensis]